MSVNITDFKPNNEQNCQSCRTALFKLGFRVTHNRDSMFFCADQCLEYYFQDIERLGMEKKIVFNYKVMANKMW